MNKSDLRAAIIRHLRDELGRQTSAAAMARDEAISEESRAESKWDTHSQEAAYLAEGQAKLAAEIGVSIDLYAALPLPDFDATAMIALGALIELEEPATRRHSWYFLGPRAGGAQLQHAGREILVVTPQSPLGRQLLGRRVGDLVTTPGRGSKPQTIVRVA
ncbi:MAG: transcription elongation factor [Opitutaceae bacterium]